MFCVYKKSQKEPEKTKKKKGSMRITIEIGKLTEGKRIVIIKGIDKDTREPFYWKVDCLEDSQVLQFICENLRAIL